MMGWWAWHTHYTRTTVCGTGLTCQHLMQTE